MVKRKFLNPIIYCGDCKLEVVETEKGMICSACGAWLSDDELEGMAS